MASLRSKTATLAAVTIALALALAMCVTSETTAFVVMENAFEYADHNLTIQCDSDVAAYPDLHFLLPRQTFVLGADAKREHQWTCSFRTEKQKRQLCGVEFSGRFIVWQHHDTPPPPPPKGPWLDVQPNLMFLCLKYCKWIVNASGLWLRLEPLGPVGHIYNWTHCDS